MTFRGTKRRGGFTLVELLTVIGIISLLISILLPSLSRARAQAKKVRVQAQLDAIGKGLEMFRNDFGSYPDSSLRQDPIDWTPAPPAPAPANGAYLSGAHWLARALAGHDFLGVDNKGLVLKGANLGTPAPGPGLGLTPPLDLTELDSSTSPAGTYSERKGTYLEGEVFFRDTDSRLQDQANGPATERALVRDGYDFPVLYYRANSRSRVPFGEIYANGGIYNHEDNASITGGEISTPAVATKASWDFAATGASHGLGWYAATNPPTLANLHNLPTGGTPPYRGKGFCDTLHSEGTHDTGNVIKPLNPETFLLISAGADGTYGTDDDVSNIKSGL
jgi:prepilin-type N-terminal cleavage/methylation domain-containing protein